MSVQALIAHFLEENGYHETLDVFQREHGKLLDMKLPQGETLQEIIADRQIYHETQRNKLALLNDEIQERKSHHFKSWSVPYPSHVKTITGPSKLIVDCAILETDRKYALMVTSSKSLLVSSLDTGNAVFEVQNVIGSVVRRILVHENRVFLCGMNGKLTVGTLDFAAHTFQTDVDHQLHNRLVTEIKIVVWNQKTYLISLGWDLMVKVFLVGDQVELKGEIKLTSQGSCMEAFVHSGKLYVLVCKKEITLMDVFCFESAFQLRFRIALNEAEFSNVGFTPMSISVHNLESPLVAIATSHEPYMRAIVVAFDDESDNGPEKIKRLQIVTNLNTLSPQDKFSDALIHWREDGSGIWIAGEDGVIRGLDFLAEEVVVSLEAHDGRMKSVCFRNDTFLTCGTDKVVKYWS